METSDKLLILHGEKYDKMLFLNQGERKVKHMAFKKKTIRTWFHTVFKCLMEQFCTVETNLCHDVAGLRPATSWGVHYTTSCNTQSSAPEDG